MALVDTTKVKTFLGITDTTEDSQLAAWVTYVDADIKDYCGWDIEQTAYPGAATNGRGDSGYYSGDDTAFLKLRQTPAILSGLAIYLDNQAYAGQNPDSAFATATLLTVGVDYMLHLDGCLPGGSTQCSYSGLVERIAGVWPGNRRGVGGTINPYSTRGMGNIKAAYTAGFSTVPAAVEMAACQLVAFIRRNAQIGGGSIQSESQGAYTYSLSSPMAGQWPELGTIKQALAKFKRVVM